MKTSKGLSLPTIIIIGFVISVLILSSMLAFNFMQERWAPSRENAHRLLKRRKYDQAMAVIEKSENSSRNIPLLIEKGRIWMTLAWEKENREGWKNYGLDENEWLKSKESDSSVTSFKKVLLLDKNNRDALYYLSIISMDKGWYGAAEEYLMRLLKNNRNDDEGRNILGVLYSRKRQYSQALREFRTAWKINDKEISTAKNLATLYRQKFDQPDSAMVWMNRYLNMNPQRDSDAGRIRVDLEDMIRRYPEIKLTEPMNWYGKREFTARGETAFQFKKKK